MSRTFSSMYKNNYSSDYVDILKMKCSQTCAIHNNPKAIDNDSIYLKKLMLDTSAKKMDKSLFL